MDICKKEAFTGCILMKMYAPNQDKPELGKISRKKVAVFLDLVQMRGGRAKFVVHFSQIVYLGQFGDGEGGRPLPNFLAHWC